MKRISPWKMTLRLMLPALICVAAVYAVMYYSAKAAASKQAFTEAEKEIILGGGEVMHVYQETDSLERAVLRAQSVDIGPDEIGGDIYKTLSRKMLATVQDPRQEGVGIAAPQVGINRRIVAVQRFDKEGEPFEVYANIRIDRYFGDEVPSVEGCLSYPPYRGQVMRRDSVIISYLDAALLQRRVEAVGGFTAIIFQHECDHLDGILYIDKATNIAPDPVWAEELAAKGI